jgi:hypothetical protein
VQQNFNCLGKCLEQAKLFIPLCGGVLGIMSGALSIPISAAAIYSGAGTPKTWFTVSAFLALWVFAFLVIRRNYKMFNLNNIKNNLAGDFSKITNRLHDVRTRQYEFLNNVKDEWQNHEWKMTVELLDKIERNLRETLTEAESAIFNSAEHREKAQLRREEVEDEQLSFLSHIELLIAKRDALQRIIESLDTRKSMYAAVE